MRLIDANALMDYCNNLKDKTIDANDIARFQTAVGWISVKDRMPELCTSVLCYAEPKDFFNEAGKLDPELVVCFRFVPLAFKPRRKCDLDERWSEPWPHFNLEYKVTHWMPLPEPPKEEKV